MLNHLLNTFRTNQTRGKPASGLIAGTLVHTQNGLIPIEQIKTGDLVLSKPENGGELAYKQVVKTFAYEPMRIMEIIYKVPETDTYEFLWATPNHPFWLAKDGWTALEHVECTEYRLLRDHTESEVEIERVRNVYVTEDPNIGWIPKYETMLDDWGMQIRFDPIKVVARKAFAMSDVIDGSIDDPYFKQPSFNLEVEDFHTYFVGELGIWVA